MSDGRDDSPSRRDFLSGRALLNRLEETGERAAAALVEALPDRGVPSAGPTVRIETRAMACVFAVVLNPGAPGHLMIASEALEMIQALEAQMTVYRPDSELSRLNGRAAAEAVEVEPALFEL